MSTASGFKILRVEEEKPVPPVAKAELVVADIDSVDYWRKMAVDTAKRLEYAEAQLKDVRAAADDARARFTKYKGRLENAQANVNELQAKLVQSSAEVVALRGQLASQQVVAKKVHEYRDSLLNGPIWELFVELVPSGPPSPAGVKE